MSKTLSSVSVILTLILALCEGCATLEPGMANAKNAPDGYNAGKESSVTYNSEGISDLVAARRNDAFEKMKAFCGSTGYKILREAKEEYSEKNESIGNMFAAEVTRIYFKCN